MTILGIETSCDECAAAVVEDGRVIRSNIVASQIPFHARWGGVVPEIASRKHVEWIGGTVREALSAAGCRPSDIDAVAATESPGLLGSLLVGTTFGRAFALTRDIPFIPVNHLYAHLYAVHLLPEVCPVFPYLGLLASGGHSAVYRIDGALRMTELGATLDDAAGEAFDKVGKHYGLPYPAGKYVDELSREGDENRFNFPLPNLYKNARPSDMSYSGLKNAAVNQLKLFIKKGTEDKTYTTADIIASFQKTAVKILLRALYRAADETGLNTVVLGGGAAANSYLRTRLLEDDRLHAVFPPLELCGDNAAMIAGLGYHAIELF